ncbi:hypothetical protein [uncultured Brevundimonas sp.]|uniref:hypothetical protein n=1 Tax=uncultured Brevundimonas sp. TaxID=213418 RepID=UPI00262D0BF3|nr:hypothetical protein [uncultured Brevundimonas sp.]
MRGRSALCSHRRGRLGDVEIDRRRAGRGSPAGRLAPRVEPSAHQHAHEQTTLIGLLLHEAVIACLEIGLGPLARLGLVLEDSDRARQATDARNRAPEIKGTIDMTVRQPFEMIGQGVVRLEGGPDYGPGDKGADHPEQEACQTGGDGVADQRLLTGRMHEPLARGDEEVKLQGRQDAQ